MDELIRVVVDDAPGTAAFNRLASSASSADKAVAGLGATVAKAQSAIQGNTRSVQSNTTASKAGTQQVNASSAAFHQLTQAASTSSSALNQMWNVGKIAIFSHAVHELWSAMASGARTVIERLTEIQQTMSLLSAVDNSALGENFEYILGVADKYGVRISALQDNYAKLSFAAQGTAMNTDAVRRIFEATSTAARVLHLRNSEVNLAFLAIVQMASKGVVSMEELRRQFAERIPGAIPALSRELGVSTAQLLKFIETGNAASDKMLPYLATALERVYGPGLALASTALDAEINRIDNSIRVFFKQVYDADGSTGPAAAIRAINEKLVQPEVAESFARFVNQISGSIEEFIRSLTADEIESAAMTFMKILEGIGTVAMAAGNGVRWLADNMSIVGPILGALAGAKLGASLGGWIGAGIGAVAGGVGGAIAVRSASGELAAAPKSEIGMREEIGRLTKQASDLQAQMDQSLAPLVKAATQRELDKVNARLNPLQDQLGTLLLNRQSPSQDMYGSNLPNLPALGSTNLNQLIGLNGPTAGGRSGTGRASRDAERRTNELRTLLDRLYSAESGLNSSFSKDLQTLEANLNFLGIEKYRDAVETLIKTQKFYTDQVKLEESVSKDLEQARTKEVEVVEQLTSAQMEWRAVQKDPVFQSMSEAQQKRIQKLIEEKGAVEAGTSAILLHRDALKAMNAELAQSAQAIDAMNKSEYDTIRSLQSGTSIARLQANRKIDLLEDRQAAIADFGPGASELLAITEAELSNLRQTLGESGKRMRDEELQEWSQTWKGVSDSFVSAMMNGGEGIAQYLRNMFTQVLAEALFRPMANELASMFVGMPGSGGGGGILGAITSFLSFEGGGRTPSGPRTGGLDGKGGFLAVVHPDETWIDETKPGARSQRGHVTHNNVAIHNTIGDVASQSMVVQAMQTVRAQMHGELRRATQYGGAS